MNYGIILAQESDNTLKRYGLDDHSQIRTLALVIVLVFAFGLGILLTMVIIKSDECRKDGISTDAPAVEQPVSDSPKDSPDFWANYYRSLWITQMILN